MTNNSDNLRSELLHEIMNLVKLVIAWHFLHEKRLQTMLWHHNARVNSHQRWKQMRFRICFHLWCELTSTMNVTEWQVRVRGSSQWVHATCSQCSGGSQRHGTAPIAPSSSAHPAGCTDFYTDPEIVCASHRSSRQRDIMARTNNGWEDRKPYQDTQQMGKHPHSPLAF